MMIKANNTIMKERIWINRVASKIVFSAWHPDNGAPLYDVCDYSSRETQFAREPHQRAHETQW